MPDALFARFADDSAITTSTGHVWNWKMPNTCVPYVMKDQYFVITLIPKIEESYYAFKAEDEPEARLAFENEGLMFQYSCGRRYI